MWLKYQDFIITRTIWLDVANGNRWAGFVFTDFWHKHRLLKSNVRKSVNDNL